MKITATPYRCRIKFSLSYFSIGIIYFVFTSAAIASRPVGFTWLKIPVGTREAAMAGSGTANALGPQALAYNPAATARISPFSAQAEYAKWFLDTHHQSLFVTRDLRHLAVGLGIATFSSGKFEYRDEVPTDTPLGTFSPLDLTGYLNLSRPLGEFASIGINLRYFYSKILNYNLSGFGTDIGTRLYPLNNLTLAAAVIDFGQTLSYKYELFWLPTRVRIGAGYKLPFGAHLFCLTIDGSYIFYTKEVNCCLGGEFTIADILSLRAGYDLTNKANHFNFGLGIQRGLFRLDYAFSPFTFNLGAAHRIAIGFGY
ncbi:MAG: PorV/PorQ family protein [bacterium]